MLSIEKKVDQVVLESDTEFTRKAVEIFFAGVPSLYDGLKSWKSFLLSDKGASLETKMAERALNMVRVVHSQPNYKAVNAFLGATAGYAWDNGFCEDNFLGFTKKLWPAVLNGDPQVSIILDGRLPWSSKDGEPSAGEFLTRCYALRVTPGNICDLSTEARVLPTTSLSRYLQNSLDGLALEDFSLQLKEVIHDQRSYTHDLITAMVHFYDTGDKIPLDNVLSWARRLDFPTNKTQYFNYEGDRKPLFDRRRYDTVECGIASQWGDISRERMPVIGFLRRLQENTKPIVDTTPDTGDPELNLWINRISKMQSSQFGFRFVLSDGLAYINRTLKTVMENGEIGIQPDLVQTIAWLDRKGYLILKDLSFEGQLSAYKEEWFHRLLEFHELTGSPNEYEPAMLKTFQDEVIKAPSGLDAYRIVTRRVLEHIGILGEMYKKRGAQWAGPVWTGNLTRKLSEMLEIKPPQTLQGAKAMREAMIRDNGETGYHPGD